MAHHISEYTDIIQKLREEVTSLKRELGHATINRKGAITEGFRPPSRRTQEAYDNVHNTVFERFSNRLDLIGSLADLQQEAMIAEMNNRVELGPLANHVALPSIKESITGRAREIDQGDTTSFELLGLEQDDKHLRVLDELQRNEQTIEGLQGNQLENAVQDPKLVEKLRGLCDAKMLESTNLELKRRVRLHTLV